MRFTTNVVDCLPEEVHIGRRVQMKFEQHGEVFMPVFVPTSLAASETGSHVPAELEAVYAVEASAVLGHLHPLGKPIVGDGAMPFLERDA